jgi:hypothetical protein
MHGSSWVCSLWERRFDSEIRAGCVRKNSKRGSHTLSHVALKSLPIRPTALSIRRVDIA